MSKSGDVEEFIHVSIFFMKCVCAYYIYIYIHKLLPYIITHYYIMQYYIEIPIIFQDIFILIIKYQLLLFFLINKAGK